MIVSPCKDAPSFTATALRAPARVLVIDDERGPRESLRILLKNEYEVLLADGVDVGLIALREQRPDVVVMDIRMPGKSGIEGLRDVRDIDPHVSVVMLTGFGTLETAQQAIRHGANDYIKKPFDTREMMELIRANVERTRVERRRAHVTEDLRLLNTELVDELTTKEHMATLGHASAEFVHDLRNPLTVVHGYAQLLAEQLDSIRDRLGDASGEAFEYLDVIEHNIQRCHEITEMWRTLGKGQGAELQRLPMEPLVRDVVRGAEPLVLSAQGQIRLLVEDQTCEVMADSLQLFRALQNLVHNAVQALPKNHGLIEIFLRRGEDGTAVVEIRDNGCGIDQEHLTKVFEPYYTTKTARQGTGLGLAITKKVIESHGGYIVVESAAGQGTCFRVILPTS